MSGDDARSGLRLGAPVRCSDGVLGELTDLVVDPRSHQVTHLVVEPDHAHGLARLVPVELASGDATAVTVRCTVAEFERLEPIETFAFLALGELPPSGEDFDVGIQQGFGMPAPGFDEVGGYAIAAAGQAGVTYDRVPKGGREIRRASPVLSADGHQLGHVEGLLLDRDGRTTHLVLERGHLWGRREVTIGVEAIAAVQTDAVRLALSKDEVGDLPAVRVRRR
jgi:sporulation protein YlmC with PRC-barrel domain